MRVIVLSSGSRGNTTYIETNETKILIDAGNNNKYICEKLKDIGVDPSEIKHILITHTHKDHVSGLCVFLKKYSPIVHLTSKMLGDLANIKNYHIIDKPSFDIDDLHIDVIKTSHDVTSSLGYILSNDNKSLVYITDTGYINDRYYSILENHELYIMESNHDTEMLMNGPYQFVLKQRILSDKGHLSNKDASRYLSSFVGNKTKKIVLAHLSEENNTPEIALETIEDKFKEKNIKNIEIVIAKQDKVLEEILI